MVRDLSSTRIEPDVTPVAFPRPHPGRLLTVLLVALTCVLVAPPRAPQAEPAPTVAGCRNPDVPRSFHRHLVSAIEVSGNLPGGWAGSPYIAKIVCWQGTAFDPSFRAHSDDQIWHGVFAMTTREVQTIAGPGMSNDRYELILTPRCFVHGWTECSHSTANTRTAQQLIAGLRWIWLDYGRPKAAWRHIVRTGRFNSYPRPGTDNTPTRSPLRLCPVRPPVTYRDDYGEPRTTGGYHPHSGNDVHAPTGRPIRAPFAGFAVAHSDDWFAGHYVTVIGHEGYVRNGHMVRFGHLGYVSAGTVIGYVGATGDARTTHNHFEWHPWNIPRILHVAPSGFSRILDGVDPFPFLNQVCRG
jgi:acetyltransferase-like isoleucine patch superfamily enzyme